MTMTEPSSITTHPENFLALMKLLAPDGKYCHSDPLSRLNRTKAYLQKLRETSDTDVQNRIRNSILEINIPWIGHYAWGVYKNTNLSHQLSYYDLFQECCVFFSEGIQHYDPNRHEKSMYNYLAQYMKKVYDVCRSDGSLIYIPRSYRDSLHKKNIKEATRYLNDFSTIMSLDDLLDDEHTQFNLREKIPNSTDPGYSFIETYELILDALQTMKMPASYTRAFFLRYQGYENSHIASILTKEGYSLKKHNQDCTWTTSDVSCILYEFKRKFISYCNTHKSKYAELTTIF